MYPFELIELPYSENVNLDGQFDGLLDMDYKLMQYTGLKDKNGVEIYEGDILKVHSYTVTGLGKVGFNKGSFVFNKFEYPTSTVLHSFSEIEVIGNIYEHPHLLGELDGKGIRDT